MIDPSGIPRAPLVECYGGTRVQSGRTLNEDAFVIERGPVPYAAVFDGAGNAGQSAGRAARFFGLLMKNEAERAGDPAAWASWVKLMDSHLLGGAQSTFVGIAVPDVQAGLAVGAYAGNSRAYLLGENGTRLVTAEAAPSRLGSGRAQARMFSLRLASHDILLLMSDGAWVPFGNVSLLRRAAGTAALAHFSDVPQAVLDAAVPPDGPPDDMTVVALRIRGQR